MDGERSGGKGFDVPKPMKAHVAVDRRGTQGRTEAGSITATRSAISQAELNQDTANLFFGEIVVIAIAIGIATESWGWGFASSIGFAIAMTIPGLGQVISVVLGMAAGAATWHFARTMGAPPGLFWSLGIFIGLGVLAMNLLGREYLADISRKDA